MSNPSAVLEETSAVRAARWPAFSSGIQRRRRDDQLPAWFSDQQQRGLDAIPEPADAGADRSGMALFECRRCSIFRPTIAGGALSDADRREILERSGGLDETAGRLGFCRRSFPGTRRPFGKAAQSRRHLPAARAGDDRARRALPTSLHEPTGHARLRQIRRAARGVRAGRELFSTSRAVWKCNCRSKPFTGCTAENAAIFPHTLVVAEELSKVTLVEHFRSADPRRAGFACGVNDLIVGAGAKVTYICAQDWSEQTLSIQINATTVARDATALNLHLALGRKIFSPRKPQPPDRRRRAQRHAGSFDWRWQPGIRRPHPAGSRSAAHLQRPAFQKCAQRTGRAIPLAA